MSRTLGAADYPFVTIEHPISSATPEALDRAARAAAATCATLLTTTTT